MSDPKIVWNPGSKETHIEQVESWKLRAENVQRHVRRTGTALPGLAHGPQQEHVETYWA
ncbi:hypothetical protein GJ744_005466 [Endocarpon pusillum]|uniref:Uncharacterized protein n=1 Tax=Endocarpon pusillum TaxID=364733 RepID=A0A8H7A4N2_9EURO|nr:hypothetical protein GJ744_005466 [Endocarpon pusillum]